jgi:hypothetical protein
MGVFKRRLSQQSKNLAKSTFFFISNLKAVGRSKLFWWWFLRLHILQLWYPTAKWLCYLNLIGHSIHCLKKEMEVKNYDGEQIFQGVTYG